MVCVAIHIHSEVVSGVGSGLPYMISSLGLVSPLVIFPKDTHVQPDRRLSIAILDILYSLGRQQGGIMWGC